jgi:hypothetical protein
MAETFQDDDSPTGQVRSETAVAYLLATRVNIQGPDPPSQRNQIDEIDQTDQNDDK